jgi:DNA-binding transcriptional MerR regulator
MTDNIITDAFKSMFPELKRHLDMTTLRHWSKKIANAKNILNKSGKKYYSQNDEDGILLEILNRIKKKGGSFLEIGVAGLSWTSRN